jgi:PPOX class probable F420-dependent enzyme
MLDDHEPASTTSPPKTLMVADISQRLARLRPYLVEPCCAVVTTLDPDGSPHPAVVHYQVEDDAIVINGRADRRWVRNLRGDPRISLVIHDADDPLHWVGIKGAAELSREGAAAVEDAMAITRRYDEDPAAYRDQERISFRILPRHVHEYAG